jgi:hypothetical protein
MRGTILALILSLGLVSGAHADDEDYTGPFTTQVLYKMCSQDDKISRDKCVMYVQGLIYGLTVGRNMQEKGMSVCMPEISPEAGRLRILEFIRGVIGGQPANNKDGGRLDCIHGSLDRKSL